MDGSSEAMSLILHGCALAKGLESNLPTIANHPNFLSSSCEEITGVFNKAMKYLLNLNPNYHPSSCTTHMNFVEPPEPQWLGLNVSRDREREEAMDFLHENGSSDARNCMHLKGVAEHLELGLEIANSQKDLKLGRQMEYVGSDHMAQASVVSRSTREFQATETLDSRRSSSSVGGASVQTSKKRRRRESGRTYKERASAPRTGNLEIPPDDGFTWRKYGQKDILNSRFPRSYYRCTHKNFYGCEAKKHVQRLDDDPHTFEVTYRGHHTCITSATPLILGSPAILQQMHGSNSHAHSTSMQLGSSSWLSGEEDRNALDNLHVRIPNDARVGCSHVQGEKEMETEVSLADVMFNSGSSSRCHFLF